MPPRARVVTWNGKDIPPELLDLPAGRYVVDPVGEEPFVLTLEEEAGIEAALESYDQGRIVDSSALARSSIQFIPIVERVTADTLETANRGWSTRGSDPRPLYVLAGNAVTERSVTADQWGRFLIAVFDEWVKRDVGQMFVQMFDAALASWIGVPPGVCIFNETCGTALALEHNGDLYSCDHFVEPQYRLGNIEQVHMLELVTSEQQRRFGLAKRDTLPAYCRQCRVRFACHGECPKNRFIETPAGEPGLNYLCAGYLAFFTHIDRPMRLMADLLRRGRYADEVMAQLASATTMERS